MSSMRFFAAWPPSAETQAIDTVPSSEISIVVPVSSWRPRITTPPLPITSRIFSGLILILMMREAAAADGGHGGRPVRLGDFRHDPHRIGEFFGRRQHRDERALRAAPVADLASLRRPHAAGLARRVGRHVVMEHEALLVFTHQR